MSRAWQGDRALAKKFEPIQSNLLKELTKKDFRWNTQYNTDKEECIDGWIENQPFQVKVLRNKNLKYGQNLTLEYKSNNWSEEGEWRDIKARYYLSGYSNETETDYHCWIIVDLKILLPWLKSWEWLNDHIRQCRLDGDDTASFVWIPYDIIPENAIKRRSK